MTAVTWGTLGTLERKYYLEAPANPVKVKGKICDCRWLALKRQDPIVVVGSLHFVPSRYIAHALPTTDAFVDDHEPLLAGEVVINGFEFSLTGIGAIPRQNIYMF